MLTAPAESALTVSSLSRMSPPAMSGVLCRECTCLIILGIRPGTSSMRSGLQAARSFSMLSSASESSTKTRSTVMRPISFACLSMGGLVLSTPSARVKLRM